MRISTLFTLASLALTCAMPVAFAASVEYTVTVQTASEIGDTGNSPMIEFQFNPSTFTTDPATATISNFAFGGPVAGTLAGSGTNLNANSSGQLPGNVTMNNAGSDYTQGIQFGSSLSFNLTLSGTAVGSTATGNGGGTFTLDFFDTNGYLFTNAATGALFTVDINPDGSTTPTAYPNPSGGPSLVSTSPEPSTCFLLGLGLLGVGELARRRQRNRAR